MTDLSKKTLIFVDDQAAAESEKLFGKDCTGQFEDIEHLGVRVLAIDNPDSLIRNLSSGTLSPDAILLDVDFGNSPLDRLRLLDPPPIGMPHWSKENWGHAILKTIKRIDPDLPVIMLTVLTDAGTGHAAGRFGAEDYCYKQTLRDATRSDAVAQNFRYRLQRAIDYCIERAVYDHEHLRMIDAFADQYDVQERLKSATSAYYRFECALIDSVLTDLANKIPNSRRVRVLDVGCGTGRIAEFLCRHREQKYDPERIEVVGVDFSGRVLEEGYKKLCSEPRCLVTLGENCPPVRDGLLHVSLYRAPAEHLQFLAERYIDKFDCAILGFGLLSYVRYKDVLPSEVAGQSTYGLVPLLNPDAKVVFSVYNEHSAIYDRIKALPSSDAEEDLPIAALMNLSTGRLRVCENREIACEAFRTDRFIRFIRQAGLSVDPEKVTTFPTAHLALRNSQVVSEDKAKSLPGFEDDQILPPGRYSPSLIELDAELSRTLRDKGHYVVGLATRRTRTRGNGGVNGD